ncbi:dyslexia-associated protein KIAA0319-like protein isoform X2 [Belonocnema kinseyi]|uniref:dyslexia-associated protein KIAA0319-like protein isoform X2 n=1 Tax=Belonocnema kinseyi TaxID=2817044 RepID=UPI00143CF1A2|nr:dyslexia-associated protein KIAA0319-like protein isoform X2 [Belonocnema kinseyi]
MTYVNYVGLCLLFLEICVGQYSDLDTKSQSQMCPGLYPKIFDDHAPLGNKTQAVYTEKLGVNNIKDCVANCCNEPLCNVAMMFNNTCYSVQCMTSKMCTPLERPEFKNDNPPVMVLVKPVEEDEEWADILHQVEDVGSDAEDGNYPLLRSSGGRCVGPVDCRENEICVKENLKADFGLCQCDQGSRKNIAGICSRIEELETGEFGLTSEYGHHVLKDPSTSSSIKPPMKQLLVSAVSKEVRLPENEVTLSAFTVPAELGNEHYNYAWSLLSQPEGHTGTMTDQNRNTVKLSNLSEGLYKFKVTVNSPTAYGEAYANVSVLPPKRINQVPIAIISPASQIVKLPNTGAVLDGSSSKDDDRVISYHWELQQGPIGYQPNLLDTPTLQLDNLIPGNYTFKLTVEDSDHETNFTTANITVLKVTDYPPSANAGQDIIIYLPQNTTTLNGNLSTDDRGIKTWEWTKSPSDENKAVDMQNTRNSSVRLSNLEEGMYTFVLKVTDTSGQSSTAEVHVFVKAPTNKPPKANAGEDITIALPQTQTVLNGSKSKDDIKIVSYHWEQISGPNTAAFHAVNESVTNITKLTKGDYEFKLTVIDDNGNKDSDQVKVKVTQTKNAPPKANAGGDQIFVAPIAAVILNGSQSSDDLRIAKWEWTREPTSLAVGSIVEGTDKSPVLMLTDIVPGRYVFKLKVTDDDGLTNEDTVSVIVKPGHGICDEETRECMCEAFWMQNLIQKYVGNGESNCDWSILYVIIALLSLVLCWVGFLWSMMCICQRIFCGKRRSSRSKKKPLRYSLLQPDAAEDDSNIFSPHKMVLSESDTESDDVLFEHRKGKTNGYAINGKSRNGFLKSGFKIKA